MSEGLDQGDGSLTACIGARTSIELQTENQRFKRHHYVDFVRVNRILSCMTLASKVETENSVEELATFGEKAYRFSMKVEIVDMLSPIKYKRYSAYLSHVMISMHWHDSEIIGFLC